MGTTLVKLSANKDVVLASPCDAGSFCLVCRLSFIEDVVYYICRLVNLEHHDLRLGSDGLGLVVATLVFG